MRFAWLGTGNVPSRHGVGNFGATAAFHTDKSLISLNKKFESSRETAFGSVIYTLPGPLTGKSCPTTATLPGLLPSDKTGLCQPAWNLSFEIKASADGEEIPGGWPAVFQR
jgi:hypothetical protein